MITLPFDESNELSFILKFPAEVEVRFIRIGFQGFTTDFSDQVLGTPSDGYVDAGLE